MALHLIGGAKPRKLNPYKRITKGNEILVSVDGQDVLAMVDNAGTYTYLTVNGVEYYVSAALESSAAYTVEDVQPKPKAEPKPKAVDPETGEVAAPKRRGKKAVAEEAAAA